MMINISVKKVLNINAEFTAKQWQLYDTAPRYVPNQLNDFLNKLVNAQNTKAFTRSRMVLVMQDYAENGACDSEAIRFLDTALDYIYSA